MIPGDQESWRTEWMRVAERNHKRGDAEEAAGHLRTAPNCWLRAADYYRQAEFWLPAYDPRRLRTFELMETCSKNFLRHRQPVLICVGGLDSIKDEMWFMQAHGALQRGISVLMIDGPGQGGTLRRHKVPTRYDYEVPIGRCIDWLE